MWRGDGQEDRVPRKTALLISGFVTAFAMVVVIGLVGASGQFVQNAQAASVQATAPVQGAVTQGATQTATSAEVATLQAEVANYRTQLQKAYQDLQSAYDQIQALNAQQRSGRRFRDDGGGF